MKILSIEPLKKLIAEERSKDIKFSYSDFAKKIGITKTEVSLFMNGKKEISHKQIERICEAYNCKPKDVVCISEGDE